MTPSHGTSDIVPDQHDEADFDIPDTQSVLETFMSKLLKQTEYEYLSLSVLLDSLPDPSSSNNSKSMTAAAAREKGVILEADKETLRAFSPLEMKLYRHAMESYGPQMDG